MAVLVACNLVPLAAILSLYAGLSPTQYDPAGLFNQIKFGTFTLAFGFMATSIGLTMLVSSNLSGPFTGIVQVLQGIRDGKFDQKVPVVSNDEIGYTGDVVNEMTQGLKERERMQRSLELAMEVQRSLLPQANPRTNGYEIAGTSLYCDETGGDYFDYLDIHDNKSGDTAVVVGDVSGHGIPSALLMATGRAFLRLRSSLPGSIAGIISDVNKQLSKDVYDSGQFMTLFLLTLESAPRRLRWIRAGHDPAILYDPDSDTFEELKGDGLALGIDEDWIFEENEKADLKPHQIIFLGTDGIWEAHNSEGDMFGKASVYDIIRQNSSANAAEIKEAIIDSLNNFRGEAEPDDDVTLVVIKVLTDIR
jgi:sigma-B regulation protein RsbU (phosphoserine phosphatase)